MNWGPATSDNPSVYLFGSQIGMQGRFDDEKPYVSSTNFPSFGKLADGKKVLNVGLYIYWFSEIPAVEKMKEYATRIGLALTRDL